MHELIKIHLLVAFMLVGCGCSNSSSVSIDLQELVAERSNAIFLTKTYCVKNEMQVWHSDRRDSTATTIKSPYYLEQSDSFHSDNGKRINVAKGTKILFREGWVANDKTSGDQILFFGEVLDGQVRTHLVYLGGIVSGCTAKDNFKAKIISTKVYEC